MTTYLIKCSVKKEGSSEEHYTLRYSNSIHDDDIDNITELLSNKFDELIDKIVKLKTIHGGD